jgi:hypothetical protein
MDGFRKTLEGGTLPPEAALKVWESADRAFRQRSLHMNARVTFNTDTQTTKGVCYACLRILDSGGRIGIRQRMRGHDAKAA